jgi:hypothetical protein
LAKGKLDCKVEAAFAPTKEYDKVAEELRSGNIDAGSWARALSEAEGDKRKAEAAYINNSLEPTTVGACRFTVVVRVTSRRWLPFRYTSP